MNEQLIQRIKQCPTLPTLPAVAVQVLELAQNPDVDIAQIAKVLSKDPALSLKILRTVNSSFYARSNPVSTISHALVFLGLQSVKTLVLGFSLVANLTQSSPKTFKHLIYWRRSIYAATAARLIASKMNLVQQEEAFLSTLLMDVGMLILDQVLGEQYGEICSVVPNHLDLPDVERDALKMTHADVGGVVTEMWKLPPVITVPVMHHHNPADVKDDETLQKLAQLAYLGGLCADVYMDQDAATAISEVRRLCVEQCQLTEADCDALLEDIGKRTKEVASLLEVNIGTPADYEVILKKANGALRQLVQPTPRPTSPVPAPISPAGSAEPLGGLADRARFDQFVKESFATAASNGQTLSLLMIEPDQLADVTAKHGQAAGDALLKLVARLARTSARPNGLATLVDGGRLAIALPGATRHEACSKAETLRRAICARPFVHGGTSMVPTASIGVSCLDPASAFSGVAHFIKAADLALANAKRGRGNSVRAFTLKGPAGPVVPPGKPPTPNPSPAAA